MRALKTLCPAFALIALVFLALPDRGHAQVRRAGGAVRAASAVRSAGAVRVSQLGYGAGRLGLTTRQKYYVAASEELDLDAGPPVGSIGACASMKCR